MTRDQMQSVHDDIAYMKALAQEGRQAPLLGGFILISAGLIFGLRGSIERITSKVFLLSPHNVTVAAEDKERLAGGFFNQS